MSHPRLAALLLPLGLAMGCNPEITCPEGWLAVEGSDDCLRESDLCDDGAFVNQDGECVNLDGSPAEGGGSEEPGDDGGSDDDDTPDPDPDPDPDPEPECLDHPDCDWDELCVDDVCETLFDRSYTVTISSATISTNTSWDVGGGAPDPYVAFAFDSSECFTTGATDTFAPNWNESCSFVFGSGGTFALIVYDEDLTDDDIMMTYAAEGNDEVASIVRDGVLSISNDDVTLTVEIERDW